MVFMSFESTIVFLLTLLHSERPKLYTMLAFLSATGLKEKDPLKCMPCFPLSFSDEKFVQNGEKKLRGRG